MRRFLSSAERAFRPVSVRLLCAGNVIRHRTVIVHPSRIEFQRAHYPLVNQHAGVLFRIKEIVECTSCDYGGPPCSLNYFKARQVCSDTLYDLAGGAFIQLPCGDYNGPVITSIEEPQTYVPYGQPLPPGAQHAVMLGYKSKKPLTTTGVVCGFIGRYDVLEASLLPSQRRAIDDDEAADKSKSKTTAS